MATRDGLFIRVPGGAEAVSFRLVDSRGQEVARLVLGSDPTQGPVYWDLGQVANGWYALLTTGSDNIIPARVVIAH